MMAEGKLLLLFYILHNFLFDLPPVEGGKKHIDKNTACYGLAVWYGGDDEIVIRIGGKLFKALQNIHYLDLFVEIVIDLLQDCLPQA